ncbi:ABC transporter [Bombiscardovia coagulans]|uniref:ABC transporter n=1 Tax=Bombiscardovia coagulans TaxID=686666 RepID=A0A261ETB0_9BIFI|nr:ABC transporter [Bombiscardovia coagulans]
MSGGEQQRVGIARALLHDLDLLIADEPTDNLDEDSEDAILSILQDLAHSQGKCVLVVTHSACVASKADQRCVMRSGRLELQS